MSEKLYFGMATNNDVSAQTFVILSEANLKSLCEISHRLNDLTNLDLGEIIFYKLKDVNLVVKTATIQKIEKYNSALKIYYTNIVESKVSNKQVRNTIYSIKCNNGWKETKNLWAIILTQVEFNKVINPSQLTTKYKDKYTQIAELKNKKDWQGIINLFYPLDAFEQNYKEIWDDAEALDPIAYALGKLTEPSDRFRLKQKLEQYFIKFNERTIELAPGQVAYHKVRDYHFYNEYVGSKNKLEKNYQTARPLIEETAKNFPDITTLYRAGQLTHTHLNSTHFKSNWADVRKDINLVENYYKKAIAIYPTLMGEYKARYKNDYCSAVYNLIKINLEFNFDYDNVFFDTLLFNNKKRQEFMLQPKKYQEFSEIKTLLDNLMQELRFNLDTFVSDMIKVTTENQVDVFYRASQYYQFVAIIYFLTNKSKDEKFKKNLDLSQKYIQKAFDLYKAREEKGTKGLGINHFIPVKAFNKYLRGDKRNFVENLLKGSDDSLYLAAELLCIDKDYTRATEILKKIDQKSLMFNKAQRLEVYINELQSN